MGIASFVLGIVSLIMYGTIKEIVGVFALLSIIFGAISIGTKQRRKFGIAGLIMSSLVLFIVAGNVINNSIENTNTKNAQNTNYNQNIDKSKVIYDKNNILIKITNYKYNNAEGNLEVYLYIKNNTEQDLTFKIDNNATLNDYTVDTNFYEVINKNTKSNEKIILRGLKNNNIKEDDLSIMKLKLDIYHSENYYIDQRIEDNLEIEYEF